MKPTPNLNNAVQALRNNVLDVFELAYLNNPVGLVHSLRQNGLTSAVNPSNKEIEPVVKRLLLVKDREMIKRVLKGVAYNRNSGNPSSNVDLWTALGVEEGNFAGIFERIVIK